jgi:hypothetical protein
VHLVRLTTRALDLLAEELGESRVGPASREPGL